MSGRLQPGSGVTDRRLEYAFPLTDPADAILLGNGRFGALLWGGKPELRFTLGRADFMAEGLQQGEQGSGPVRLPIGRVTLEAGNGYVPVSGGLHLLSGEAELELGGRRDLAKLRAVVLPDEPLLCVRVAGPEAAGIRIAGAPHASAVGAEPFDLGEFAGWTQRRPAGDHLCVAWLRAEAQGGGLLYVTSVFGEGPVEARRRALKQLESGRARGFMHCTLAATQYWRKWWQGAGVIQVGSGDAGLLYTLGMHRLGCMLTPGCPVPGATGPWTEDHRPAYVGGAILADARLWLLHAPVLSGAAPAPEGLFTMPVPLDTAPLWNLMNWRAAGLGAAERSRTEQLTSLCAVLQHAGGTASFPADADGTGAPDGDYGSYQLALLHGLAAAITDCRAEAPLPDGMDRLLQSVAALPDAVVSGAGDEREILPAAGVSLRESRALHNHLAGLYPFESLDYGASDADRRLVQSSLARLARAGTGVWTGESFPWAALLYARTGNGEAALHHLRVYRHFFLSDGLNPLAEARWPGVTLYVARAGRLNVIGATAAAAAVAEMLAATVNGSLRVFPACPREWPDAAFQGFSTTGGTLVSGVREAGRTVSVELRFRRAAQVRVVNPWGDHPVALSREGGGGSFARGRLLRVDGESGDTITLSPR